MKRRDFFRSVVRLPGVLFGAKKSPKNRAIGLNDRNNRPIYENNTLRCKVKHPDQKQEITGVVRWSKYIAGFSLQEGDRTIGTFRHEVWGPYGIKEMPDGRIDGVILGK